MSPESLNLAGTFVKKCAVDIVDCKGTRNNMFLILIVKKRVQFIIDGGPFVV